MLLKLFSYFPLVFSAVMAVEASVAGEAKGAAKKQIILDAVEAAAKIGGTSDQKLVAGISQLIDTIVTSLNALGVFGHTPTPAK